MGTAVNNAGPEQVPGCSLKEDKLDWHYTFRRLRRLCAAQRDSRELQISTIDRYTRDTKLTFLDMRSNRQAGSVTTEEKDICCLETNLSGYCTEFF